MLLFVTILAVLSVKRRCLLSMSIGAGYGLPYADWYIFETSSGRLSIVFEGRRVVRLLWM